VVDAGAAAAVEEGRELAGEAVADFVVEVNPLALVPLARGVSAAARGPDVPASESEGLPGSFVVPEEDGPASEEAPGFIEAADSGEATAFEASGDLVEFELELGKAGTEEVRLEPEGEGSTASVGDNPCVDSPFWALVPIKLDEEPRPRSAAKGRGTKKLGMERSSSNSNDRPRKGAGPGWRRGRFRDGRPRKACRKERRKDMKYLPRRHPIRRVLLSAVSLVTGRGSHGPPEGVLDGEEDTTQEMEPVHPRLASAGNGNSFQSFRL
jgi:hypothetical protein